MKTKIVVSLLVMFLLCISISGCSSNKISSYQNNSSSPSYSKISNPSVPTGSSSNTIDTPSDSKTEKTGSSTNRPVVSTTEAMGAYQSVLQNKVNLFSTDDKKYIYLNEFLRDGAGPGYPYKLTRFTILDLDGDKIPEVVLELQIGGAGFFEVLHYMNGTVYGYNIVYRGLEMLKADGTFWSSSGASDNSCGKMRFSSIGYEMDVLGYSESSQNNDGTTVSYFINTKPVTAESFNSFVEEQRRKKDVVWYEFSQNRIEAELST